MWSIRTKKKLKEQNSRVTEPSNGLTATKEEVWGRGVGGKVRREGEGD